MRRMKMLVAMTAVVALQAPVQAGMNSASYVRVYTSSAFGPLHDARFNAGSIEYIGCSVQGHNYTTSGRVYCSARDADGDFLSCFKSNASNALLNAVGSINEASDIEFYVDSSTGECQTIYVENYSSNL